MYYYIIKGLLHEYWWILSLAVYYTALIHSRNMIYWSRQYSPIFMQWPYIVIHLGVLVSHGWATMPGWSGISWWQLRDKAKYHMRRNTLFYFITSGSILLFVYWPEAIHVTFHFLTYWLAKSNFCAIKNHIALSCKINEWNYVARECNMVFIAQKLLFANPC